MSEWILDWCDSGQTEINGREVFNNKTNLLERLEELKDEVKDDELEYSYYKGKKCPCCGTIVKELKSWNK